jgi:hypothetical protein
MGLFDKIKGKDKQTPEQSASSSPLPSPQTGEKSFDFGGQDLEIPKFPEPNIPEDKHEEQPMKVEQPTPVELPRPAAQIKKAVSRPMMKQEVNMPRMRQAPEEPRFPEPSFMNSGFSQSSMMDTDKPLFVKIEKYDEAMTTIKAVKERLKDAQQVIAKLERIKLEEDKEIQAWSRDIEAIKDKMINIDQILFEVHH